MCILLYYWAKKMMMMMIIFIVAISFCYDAIVRRPIFETGQLSVVYIQPQLTSVGRCLASSRPPVVSQSTGNISRLEVAPSAMLLRLRLLLLMLLRCCQPRHLSSLLESCIDHIAAIKPRYSAEIPR